MAGGGRRDEDGEGSTQRCYRSCNLRRRPSPGSQHLVYEQSCILQGKGNSSPLQVHLLDFKHLPSKGSLRPTLWVHVSLKKDKVVAGFPVELLKGPKAPCVST